MSDAFHQANKKGGVYKAASYPYTSGNNYQTGTCQFQASQTSKIGVKVAGYRFLEPYNFNELKQAVRNIGPIAVAVDASSWGSYSDGLYTGCSSGYLNHAVLIVGFKINLLSGLGYWIVKNSW